MLEYYAACRQPKSPENGASNPSCHRSQYISSLSPKKQASAVEQLPQAEQAKREVPMEAWNAGKLSDSRSQTGEREQKLNAFGPTRTQRISWKAVVFAVALIPAEYLLDRCGRNGVDRIAFHRCITPVECNLHSVFGSSLITPLRVESPLDWRSHRRISW